MMKCACMTYLALRDGDRDSEDVPLDNLVTARDCQRPIVLCNWRVIYPACLRHQIRKLEITDNSGISLCSSHIIQDSDDALQVRIVVHTELYKWKKGYVVNGVKSSSEACYLKEGCKDRQSIWFAGCQGIAQVLVCVLIVNEMRFHWVAMEINYFVVAVSSQKQPCLSFNLRSSKACSEPTPFPDPQEKSRCENTCAPFNRLPLAIQRSGGWSGESGST